MNLLLETRRIICFALVLFLTASELEAGWSAPRNVSEKGKVVFQPNIAVNNAGKAIAVWTKENESGDVIQAAVTPFDGASITTLSGHNASNPAVGISDVGLAQAVWEGMDVGDRFIQLANFDFTSGWELPATDLSNSGDTPRFPQIGVGLDDQNVIIWENTDGVSQTYIEAFDSNQQFPFNLSVPEYGEPATQPALTFANPGNAVALWKRFDGSHTIIQAAINSIITDNGWSYPVNLSAPGEDATNPQVNMNFAGYAVAVWSRFDGLHSIIQARTMQFGRPWSPILNISEPNLEGTFPVVGVDSTGNAVAVWLSSNGKQQMIKAAILRSGTFSWSAPINISEVSINFGAPQLALNRAGNVVVVWSKLGKNNISSIQAVESRFGGKWSWPVNISSNGKNSIEPKVGIDSFGNPLVIWSNLTEGVIQVAKGTNLFPSAPLNFQGKVINKKFLTQTDRIHQLTWEKSLDLSVKGYEIFRNGQLISTIPASGPFIFIDHNRSRRSSDTYVIRAINAAGIESTSLTVTLR